MKNKIFLLLLSNIITLIFTFNQIVHAQELGEIKDVKKIKSKPNQISQELLNIASGRKNNKELIDSDPQPVWLDYLSKNTYKTRKMNQDFLEFISKRLVPFNALINEPVAKDRWLKGDLISHDLEKEQRVLQNDILLEQLQARLSVYTLNAFRNQDYLALIDYFFPVYFTQNEETQLLIFNKEIQRILINPSKLQITTQNIQMVLLAFAIHQAKKVVNAIKTQDVGFLNLLNIDKKQEEEYSHFIDFYTEVINQDELDKSIVEQNLRLEPLAKNGNADALMAIIKNHELFSCFLYFSEKKAYFTHHQEARIKFFSKVETEKRLKGPFGLCPFKDEDYADLEQKNNDLTLLSDRSRHTMTTSMINKTKIYDWTNQLEKLEFLQQTYFSRNIKSVNEDSSDGNNSNNEFSIIDNTIYSQQIQTNIIDLLHQIQDKIKTSQMRGEAIFEKDKSALLSRVMDINTFIQRCLIQPHYQFKNKTDFINTGNLELLEQLPQLNPLGKTAQKVLNLKGEQISSNSAENQRALHDFFSREIQSKLDGIIKKINFIENTLVPLGISNTFAQTIILKLKQQFDVEYAQALSHETIKQPLPLAFSQMEAEKHQLWLQQLSLKQKMALYFFVNSLQDMRFGYLLEDDNKSIRYTLAEIEYVIKHFASFKQSQNLVKLLF